MLIEPEHPTKEYMLGRITFHESQAQWFAEHGQTQLATWARSIVESWRGKLKALQEKETTGEGTIQ